MSKKTSKTKDPQDTENGPAEENIEPSGSTLSELQPPEEAREAPSSDTSPTSEQAEVSPEDLLEDVRRSLIEEETDKNQKQSKWWRRIGKKRKNIEPEEPPVNEIDLPTLSTPIGVQEKQEQKEEPENEQADEIDELIDMLAAEPQETAVESAKPTEPEVPAAPEPPVDFEKLKEQAFRPRTGEESESLSDVRSVALEGGEEVFVEVQAPPVDPMQERLHAYENALKPYRRYINITLAFLGVFMAAMAALIIYSVYQRSRPQPVKESPNLPYPTSLSLPGGWSFQLGRGVLQDGNWQPNGPEWLEGTEVCRWVALPWSRQLEAVIRTLNQKDSIELLMSNNDKLAYQVYSVRQLTPAEIQKVNSNSPCLLLILTRPDTEKRWVLTALP